MLEPSNACDLMSQQWDATVEKAELPPREGQAFLRKSGVTPVVDNDLRRRRRYYYRRRGVLRSEGRPTESLGVYCRDLSQSGVAVLSPRPLLPMEQGRLTVSLDQTFELRVRYCRRLGESCYLLGCDFEVKADGGPLRKHLAT